MEEKITVPTEEQYDAHHQFCTFLMSLVKRIEKIEERLGKE